MPSLTDKIKGKLDEAKQKAEQLKEQAKAKAKILKLRAEAAGVIVKAKPLLLKEKTWSKDRAKKIAELAKKADELKDDKVGTYADLLKKHATSYLKAIDQQIKLIKDVSVLNSPPEEIQKFIVDMKTWVGRADHYYDLYRTNKVKLRNYLKADKKDWPKKLSDWFAKEKPTWKSAEKILGELADSAGSLLRGAKEAIDFVDLFK